MPKRRQHRVSEAQDGGVNVRRRGTGSPEPRETFTEALPHSPDLTIGGFPDVSRSDERSRAGASQTYPVATNDHDRG
jgi:hypothetical protein